MDPPRGEDGATRSIGIPATFAPRAGRPGLPSGSVAVRGGEVVQSAEKGQKNTGNLAVRQGTEPCPSHGFALLLPFFGHPSHQKEGQAS